MSFTTRQALEQASTFDEALDILNNTDMVGPSYMILGGAKTGQGAIITRAEAESLHLWTIENNLHNTDFYGESPMHLLPNWSTVVETNYDHWKAAPVFDDRRLPAMACMKQLGQDGVSFKGLYNVLSGQPNLNMLTTYTTLMDIETGHVEAYIRDCKWPCTPW